MHIDKAVSPVTGVDAVSVVSKLVHTESTMLDDEQVARLGFAAWFILSVGSRSAERQPALVRCDGATRGESRLSRSGPICPTMCATIS